MNILIVFIMYFITYDIYQIFGFAWAEKEQNIKIKAKTEGQNIYIDRERHIVNPSKPLYITIENFTIYNIDCRNYHTSYKFLYFINNQASHGTEIQISSVTDVMSGIWECTFKRFNFNEIINFDIEVLDAQPRQSIIINNVVLPLYKRHSNFYKITYSYKDGETVDIKCVSRKINYCSLNIAFILNKSNNDKYKIIPGSIRLKAIHNNSHITCTSTCLGLRGKAKLVQSVIVKFFLKNSIEMATRLKINNTEIVLTTMGDQPSKDYMTFYANYAYFMPVPVDVVCDLLKRGYALSLQSDLPAHEEQVDEGTTMKLIKLVPKSYAKIIFNARNHATIIEKLVITFTHISTEEYEIQSWEGFSSSAIQTKPPGYNIFTKKTTNFIEDYTTKAVILPSTSSTTTSMSFRSTTIAPDIEPPQKWIAAVVSAIIIIVLIIISAAVYKMRKHTLSKRETYDHNEESPNDDSSTIPAYPEQWNSEAAYTNLTDLSTKRKSIGDKEDNVYATPDVKYETLVNPKNVDYQNLKMFNKTEVVSKDVYAQVIPKSKRHEKTYANIAKKLVPENEHTLYCEINSPRQ